MMLRILYVEDNRWCGSDSELLAQEERQVIALATAEEALDEFKVKPFDVVITDISLPRCPASTCAQYSAAQAVRAIIIASDTAHIGGAEPGPQCTDDREAL